MLAFEMKVRRALSSKYLHVWMSEMPPQWRSCFINCKSFHFVMFHLAFVRLSVSSFM